MAGFRRCLSRLFRRLRTSCDDGESALIRKGFGRLFCRKEAQETQEGDGERVHSSPSPSLRLLRLFAAFPATGCFRRRRYRNPGLWGWCKKGRVRPCVGVSVDGASVRHAGGRRHAHPCACSGVPARRRGGSPWDRHSPEWLPFCQSGDWRAREVRAGRSRPRRTTIGPPAGSASRLSPPRRPVLPCSHPRVPRRGGQG